MPKDLNSKQAGFNQSADVNDPSVRVIKGKNLFPQSFQHPSTTQYGVVDPVFFAKCERGDVFPYKFVTDLNTFTLASPLKSKVKMYSSAFKVPMEAIYPRNWDIMLPIPNKGEDVPDDTRAVLPIRSLIVNLSESLDYSFKENQLSRFIKSVFLAESIYSAGSLFSKANLHFSHIDVYTSSTGDISFDDYFDSSFVPSLISFFESLQPSGDYHIYPNESGLPRYTITSDSTMWGKLSFSNTYYIGINRAIELLRSGLYNVNESSTPNISDYFVKLILRPSGFVTRINIESIVSYNLACAHFFNNPKVDYIYSAQLYRDNLESIYLSDHSIASFDWNGITKIYDIFSERVFVNVITNLASTFYPSFKNAYYFLTNIFNFHNSLRYGDYFTGAHPEPIAPGDINIPVVDNSVNAIDTTKKLQLARLLNKVNISGPRISDYLRALFGGPLPEAPADVPVRLSKESFDVGGFEVNNTGTAQLDSENENITTTNLRLEDSRYMFEASIDKPCWIVVVQYFEAHRIYSKTLDRFAYHFDRFDDFIPDLQFIGDQDVKSSEIDSSREGSVPFAYNLRYMEYKQRYSYASGGFINKLKSWAFVTDNFDGNPATNYITPEYIRSSPTEFDRFYKSLTGYSLGTRFHFITFNTNVATPYRQMVYAPEILN